MRGQKVITTIAIVFAFVMSGHQVYAAPENNNFANAHSLNNVILSYTGSAEATKEPDEPNHALSVGGKSVWYKYVAPIDGYLGCDYYSDNRADLGVFRPSTSTWYILQSSTGTSTFIPFGLSGDFPLTASNPIR